jgi:hypothetical protein
VFIVVLRERVVFKIATGEALLVNKDKPLTRENRSLISWYALSIFSPGARTCAKSASIFDGSISDALPSNPSSKPIYPPSIKVTAVPP